VRYGLRLINYAPFIEEEGQAINCARRPAARRAHQSSITSRRKMPIATQ